MKILLVICCIISFKVCVAQSVGINTTTPDPSAALDVNSLNKGFLLPRVASVNTIPSPANGLMVYNTGGAQGLYINAGTSAAPTWLRMVGASGFIPGGILYGTSTGAGFTSAGTAGQFLISNGAAAPTWSNLGQSVYSSVSSGNLLIQFHTNQSLGLDMIIDIPPNCIIYYSTTGGANCNECLVGQDKALDVTMMIDDAIIPPGGARRVNVKAVAEGPIYIGSWSISGTITLPPGPHLFSVYAKATDSNPINVLGGPGDLREGTLTILIIKQ